jgi:hypothetical protein
MAKKKGGETPEAEELRRQRKEAVIKAREALGPRADVAALGAYIKDKLGMDIENKVIGIHLHHLGRERRKSKKAAAANSGARKAARGGDVSFAEIRAVKDMVQRHGAQRLRDLIDLVS